MTSQELLNKLNSDYLWLHEAYEWNFWYSYMWDKTKDEDFVTTKTALEEFKTSKSEYQWVCDALEHETDDELRIRLWYRKQFFELYAIPEQVRWLRDEIIALEKKIESNRATRETGYKDPKTGEFVKMSIGVMRSKMMTEDDEVMRKVYFDGAYDTITDDVDDLIELVAKRNEYARALWYKHFYDFKTQIEERMDCEEIWKLFVELREGAQRAFDYVRELEKTEKPWLRKPWNAAYMLSGDFIKQDDPYFQMEDAIERRGRSMMNLWVNYAGCEMQLDLLERDGKYQNGFCHMPTPTHYAWWLKIPTRVNFTCDNKPWVIGEWSDLSITLFHEWGHAAHFANMNMKDVILNTEYPPASTARAETQSMFMDTMNSSIERSTRYANYPFALFEEKTRKLRPLAPKRLMSICAIVDFERRLYTSDELTKDIVIEFAKQISDRYFDYSESLLFALLPVHIYSWESSCSYHGYGLAELWLHQLRAYFYNKYGYIVDNPKVGEEMTKRRNVWSSISFNECLKWLTGEWVSTKAYLANINRTVEEVLEVAKERIAKLETIPQTTNPIDIWAKISIVDGNDIICDNSISFEDMCEKFKMRIETKKE